jgi:hypothetical protein
MASERRFASMYVHIYVCRNMNVHICISKYIYMYIDVHRFAAIRARSQLSVQLDTHKYLHIYVHTCVYKHIHMYISICMYVSI